MVARRVWGLNARMLAVLGCACVILAMAVVLSLRATMRANSVEQAALTAERIASRNLAIHEYFTKELKPSIYPLSDAAEGADYFDARWMSSSYASSRIEEMLKDSDAYDGFYYRDVVVNARNPMREADDVEAAFIARLESDTNVGQVLEVRDIDGEPYYVLMRRGEMFTEACMRCHGDPADAPAELVAHYGDTAGFGRRIGSASIASVRVPLAVPYAAADKAAMEVIAVLAVITALMIGVLYLFNRFQIVRPIRAVQDAAQVVADGDVPPGTSVEVRGPAEVVDLARQFSVMSKRVADTIDSLEDRVAQRTQTLDAMNQELLAEITERETVEDMLAAEKAYAERLIETANVLVVGLDNDGAVTVFNRHAEDVTGFSAEDIIGEAWFETACPKDRFKAEYTEWMEHYDPRKRGFMPVQGRERKGRIRTADGRERLIEWRNSSVVMGGETVGSISFGMDVTEAIRQREELERYKSGLEVLVEDRTRQLESTNDELRRATAAKSQFLANMSHELRTPLNSVIGFTDVLLNEMAGPLNEEQTRQLTMVNDAGRYLLALVNDVLDLSKVENGAVAVTSGDFDVVTVIKSVAASLEPSVRQRGLELVVECPSESLMMSSDETKVRQILVNIASNAVKFTTRGMVRMECASQGGEVVISVADTGPGIPADEVGSVFAVFWQAKVGDEAKPEGAGLGLAIARRLAHLLGGGITVSSEVGRGSVFTVTLPQVLPAFHPVSDDDEVLL